MMLTELLHNKRVLVVGLGVTGASVVRYLHSEQVAFDVVDENARPSAQLRDCLLGVQIHEVLDASLCCAYDVLVVSPGVPRSLPAIHAAIEQGIEVIGDIELFAHAIGNTPVIAVTGSNGKSTVVSWIAHVLENCGKPAKLCGNIGLPALDSIDDEAELYVLELSSYQLESTYSLFALSATVLNVSDDHLDRYESIEHYAAIKRRIYNDCSHRVVNRDDQRTWIEAEKNSSKGVGSDSTGEQNEVAFSVITDTLSDYSLSDAANDAWLCRGDNKLVQRNRLQNPGDHNVANALAVLALLEPFALNMDEQISGLTSFPGLEHRTEFVLERHGVRWYNDSKGTNIDACKKAIEAMEAQVVLIAGGLGKGADFNALRDVVQKQVKALVLIGEDAALIKDALNGTTNIVMAQTLEDAVQRCSEFAVSGDVVLLSPACSSFDMFDNFEQRGVLFKQAVETIAA